MTTDPIASARALIEPLREHREQQTVAGGSWWEAPEICAQAADAIATLADALEDEMARTEKAEVERDEWKDEYQAVRLLLTRYKDAATNRQTERDQALARLAAVKRATKCARCGSDGGFGCYECTPSDEADAALQRVVADALEAERAKVAAAYEAAAALPATPDWRWRFEPSWSATDFAEAIRALTSADAQAALDKMLAEARREGWRAGRDAAANEAALYSCTEGSDDYTKGVQEGYADAVVQIEDGIRALPEPKEASHE